MKRLIAFLILFIPGAFAAYGIKIMRDSGIRYFTASYPFLWLQFLIGLLITIVRNSLYRRLSSYIEIENKIRSRAGSINF